MSNKLKGFLENLLERPKLHDVEFIFPFEDVKIKALKGILAANSEVWERMFKGKWKENGGEISRITMVEEESEIFKILIKFCYIREISMKEDQYVRVLIMAEKYLHKDLVKIVSDMIMEKDENPRFMLRTLIDLCQYDLDINLVHFLKKFIKTDIYKNAYRYLNTENLFMYLSPLISNTILKLFSQKTEELHEDTKLKRMIEYGQCLVMDSDEWPILRNVLFPFLKHLNPLKLSVVGIQLLKTYKIYSKRFIIELSIKIMEVHKINKKIERDIMKYKMEDAINISGNIMINSLVNEVREYVNCPPYWWMHLLPGHFLTIELHKPCQVHSIVFSLKYPSAGLSFNITYSEHGQNFQLDSEHWASVDTLLPHSLSHKFYVQTTKKYTFWKIQCGTISNDDILHLGGQFSLNVFE